MAAEIFSDLSRANDANGNTLAGATWTFYATGTSTPQNVYANAALSTSLGSVVTADSGGKFVPIYFDASLSYRGVLKDAGGSTIRDIDPINASAFREFAEFKQAAEFTLSGSFTYAADFFNPTDDYVRSDCMVRATDTGSHAGKIRFGQFISADSRGTSPNGPANAFVGLGVSNIKTNFLTSTSTQETDGLFIQTKTGRFGDTSAILADAWAINVPGVSTSFANLIEGAAGCFNTSGVPVSKIRFQAANQYQAGTPGTIEGVGCHIIAEVGTQVSALDISNTASTAAWTNAFRLITDTGIKHHILGNGYTGINGIADSQIPLLINAHPDGLTQRHYFAENGAGLGPVENFFRYSLSPANNDLLGSITFDGMNSAAAQKTFASIRVQAVNVGSGTEQGGIFGFVTDAGTLAQSFAGFKDSFYIVGALYLNNTKVLGPRATGWSADTGTAKRTANATYSATAGASYSQAQIQALMDAVRDATQTIKAVKDDLITHGVIGA